MQAPQQQASPQQASRPWPCCPQATLGTTAGYVAVGFSESGGMVGSEAVIGWVDSSGLASIQPYLLNAKTMPGVVRTDAFAIRDAEGSELDGYAPKNRTRDPQLLHERLPY